VKGLRELTKKHMKLSESNKYELASAMEFVLDGLHQSSRIAKDEVDRLTAYKDLVGSIFTGKGKSIEEEF
jgi:magnesium chelatase subunit I